MPIDYREYHKEWKKISREVKERAGWGCELCPARHGEPHWKTGSRVVLTVHHIDGDKKNNSRHNLIALCQRCHLRLDRGRRIRGSRQAKGKSNDILSELWQSKDHIAKESNYDVKELGKKLLR